MQTFYRILLIIELQKSAENATCLLNQPYWLPVPQQMNYEILMITFKALHSLCPAYFTDLLQSCTPPPLPVVSRC